MASNRTTQAALTIALSLFVMLTFALAVTTYLFFSKRQEADTAQQAAAASAAEAQAAMQATKDEMATLRGIIGVAEDMPIADVETGLAKLFEGDFQGFAGDEKSYLKLIEWLRAEFRSKAEAVKKAEADKAAADTKATADVKAAQDALETAKTAEAKAKADLDAATKQFAENRAAHETQQGKLLDEKRSEEEKARDLEGLKVLGHRAARWRHCGSNCWGEPALHPPPKKNTMAGRRAPAACSGARIQSLSFVSPTVL